MRASRKWILRMAVLLGLMILACGISAAAAPANGWSKEKNKCYYYVNHNRVTGLQNIGGRMYYFDGAGVQRTSWRQIGDAFYCFHEAEMADGYLYTNITKNGIRIGADGRAALTSERAVRKANVMVRVSALVDQIIDSNKKKLSTNYKKLRACYDFMRKKIRYRFVSHFRQTDPNWDLWSVEQLLARGYADCHPYACTFAYVANALGYQDIIIKTWHTPKYGVTGHSWVVMGGRVYDVSYGRHNKRSFRFFGMKEKRYLKMNSYLHVKVVTYVNNL